MFRWLFHDKTVKSLLIIAALLSIIFTATSTYTTIRGYKSKILYYEEASKTEHELKQVYISQKELISKQEELTASHLQMIAGLLEKMKQGKEQK